MTQVLVTGIVNGLIIALLATAFSLVYVPTRVFHVAFGGIFAVVPFIVLECKRHTAPTIVAFSAAVVTAVMLSIACEWMNHARLERKRASLGVHLAASLGIYIILVQAIALIWGSDTRTFESGARAVFRVTQGIQATKTQFASAATCGMLMLGFHIWLRRTNLGTQFRALADNPTELALLGYNIKRLRLVAFGMSGAICAAGALCVAYDAGFDPYFGLHYALLAAIAVIVGGRSSFTGPILGGLILGILQAHVVWFLSARWQDTAAFVLLAAFLFLRPSGIVGQAGRLEVEP